MQWFEPDHETRRLAAPDFRLTSPAGTTWTRSQFRSTYHLVLVFMPTSTTRDSERLLEQLAQAKDELTLANARIFIISPRVMPAPETIPLLIDAHGAVRTEYAARIPDGKAPASDEPLLIILNRYGVLEFAGSRLAESAPEDVAQSVVERVWSLEYQCSL